MDIFMRACRRGIAIALAMDAGSRRRERMLRTVEESATNNSITLRLDGRLVSEWVGVLRSSCEQAFQNKSRLKLNLAGVSFADQDGVRLLQHLEQQHVA